MGQLRQLVFKATVQHSGHFSIYSVWAASEEDGKAILRALLQRQWRSRLKGHALEVEFVSTLAASEYRSRAVNQQTKEQIRLIHEFTAWVELQLDP